MIRLREAGLALAVLAAPALAQSPTQSMSLSAPMDRGIVRGHNVHNSITVNPFGFFSPPGVDLQYQRSLSDKVSGLIGARIQSSRDVNPYALTLGGNYFLLGRRNEGLYIGPRLSLGLGSPYGSSYRSSGTITTGGNIPTYKPSQGNGPGDPLQTGGSTVNNTPGGRAIANAFTGVSTYRDSAGAELGYDWISRRGLTVGIGAGADVGFGRQLAATQYGQVTPYAALNVGWSW